MSTTPVFERKVIQDPNLIVFVQQICAAVKDGWELDEQNPPCLMGFYYETHLLKDESLVDKTPTRADIAANARSAKKLKAESTAKSAEESST